MGEHENYIDMCHHAKMGYYKSTVSEQYVPYVMPRSTATIQTQNCLRFITQQGTAWSLKAILSLTPHTLPHMITNAMHTNKLKPRKETILRVDYKVGGVGSASCGPELLKIRI